MASGPAHAGEDKSPIHSIPRRHHGRLGDGTQHRASEIGTMLLLSNVEEESKPDRKVDGDVPIFATRLAFVEGSTGKAGDFMDRMHRIIVVLALGSSVLGGLALASLTVGGPAIAGGAGGEVGIGSFAAVIRHGGQP